MSTLPIGRYDAIIRDPEGDTVSGAAVEIRREGATVNGAQSITSGTAVLVNDIGGLVSGDTVIIETNAGVVGTTTYSASLVSIIANQVFLSGFAGTLVLNDEDRIVPVNSLPTLYNDIAGDETLANPMTSGSDGAVRGYLRGGPIDVVKSGSGITTRLERDVQISAGDSWIKLWESPWNCAIDGSTDDILNVSKAISRVYTEGGGLILLPGNARVMRVSTPVILLDRVRLAGMSKRGSVIEPTDTFVWNGTTTALVQIGAVSEASNIFDARVEELTIMCRGQANSIGIYSDSANEGSGWRDVLVRQAALKGVYLTSAASRNLYCQGIEIGLTTATAIGIHLSGVTEHNTFVDITVGNSSGAATTARGILVDTASWADFIRVHSEDCDIGVEYDATSQGIVYGLVGARNITALIKFGGDGQGAYSINPVNSDPLILDASGHTGNTVAITNAALGSYYHIGRGAQSGGGGRDLHTDYMGTVATPTTRATQLNRLIQGRNEFNHTLCLQRNPIVGAATINGTLQANRGNIWTLTGATPVTSITVDSSDSGRLLLIGTDGTAGGGLVDGSNLDLEGDWLPTSTADNILLLQFGSGYQEVARRRPMRADTQTVTLTTAPQTITLNDQTRYLRLTRADGAVAGSVSVTITYTAEFAGRMLNVYVENNDVTGGETVVIPQNASHDLSTTGDFSVAAGGTARGMLSLVGDGVSSIWRETGRVTLA